ncbi:MAG: lyase family protein [Thermoproteus sp.]
MGYTERAAGLFLSTGTKFPRRIIWAMGLVKLAYARANGRLGLLPSDAADAVAEAARGVAEGLHDDRIAVDVFQTGSGTGLNMNINEVIADLASRRLGRPVHPNDHVNLGQSSNDVVPTAIRIAAAAEAEEGLLPALRRLVQSLESKAEQFGGVVKPGRTHLRDALPVTLGQELSAYADAFRHDGEAIRQALEYVKEVPLGGTAVGTGLNAHPGLPRLALEEIDREAGLCLKPANAFRAMRLLTDLLLLSGVLRTSAVDLYRLGQDVRLMFSGPAAGLNEIDLPSQGEVAGSSMMPGKTNPITVEAAMQAAAQVVGLDHANQIAAMLGEFELAMGIPLMGSNAVAQIGLLAEAFRKTAELVVDGIVPHVERMRRLAESSAALITAISPVVGYDKASEVGRRVAGGLSIREALRELGYSDEEIDRLLDVDKLTRPGFPVEET